MKLRDIKLKKNMMKDEVNALVGCYTLLEDEVYIGSTHKHNWMCLKCGKIFNRLFGDIKKNCRIDCGCVEIEKQETRYKHEVEKDGDYEYIRSYRKGDVLPNGKVVGDNPYIQVKHKYCGSVYQVNASGFINQKYRCDKCCQKYKNSFAYHIEVELGLNINDVWDFEKNTLNPYHIHKNYNGKVWIKCMNEDVNELNGLKKKDYHGSYEIRCGNFTNGRICGYCNTFASQGKKVHVYDSFGYKHFDKVCMNWNYDNKTSPFKICKSSRNKHHFICDECKNDFLQSIDAINRLDTWCPKCASSKGEKRIEKWLRENGIQYESQKEFEGLIGVNYGNLRYDFYLPNHNLLIEYQGEFHDGNTRHQTEDDVKKQREHDRRKKQYSIYNNIKLLEIWYYDKDNIENILERSII